jgi:hypothetical protein
MPTGSAPGHLPSRDERPSWLMQFLVLCHRSALNAYRNPGLTFARVGQGVFTGLLYGFTFYQLGYSSRDVQNRRGAIFLVLIATQFSSIFGILNICTSLPDPSYSSFASVSHHLLFLRSSLIRLCVSHHLLFLQSPWNASFTGANAALARTAPWRTSWRRTLLKFPLL